MRRVLLIAATTWVLFAGCTLIKTEHHITLDHNITIRIEKEAEDFLDDLYGEDEEDAPVATPQKAPPAPKK